jgi:hypothetical protein
MNQLLPNSPSILRVYSTNQTSLKFEEIGGGQVHDHTSNQGPSSILEYVPRMVKDLVGPTKGLLSQQHSQAQPMTRVRQAARILELFYLIAPQTPNGKELHKE